MTIEPAVRVIRERRPRSPKIVLRSTPEIIERAIPADSSHCIWADALKEAFPTATKIAVDLQSIRFTDPAKGCRYTYLTPRAVQVDLVKFDQGIKPEPMSIRIQGGHVTQGGTSKVKSRRNVKPIPARTELTSSDGPTQVMRRVGGQPPPVGALAHVGGKRRVFGIRGLGRVVGESQP